MNIQKMQQPAWWSFGHVWLVIAGPLLVVVASFVSAFVAFQGNDTALQDDPLAIRAAHNMQVAKDRSMAPAVQARNHAATPEGQALTRKP
jgi:hypothetical protein